MESSLAVAIGGAIGALSRYGLSHFVYQELGREFPWATLIVNALGSLLAGLIIILLTDARFAINDLWRHALMVGFLGALTTFSTFSIDTVLLIQESEWLKAALNIVANVVICLIAVCLGMWSAKQFLN